VVSATPRRARTPHLMPIALHPLPDHSRPRSPLDSLAVRLRVRMHGAELDDQLARGCSPHTSPELALRAAQITRRDERARIALTLERLVEAAQRPRGPSRDIRAPLRRTEILERRPAILRLARDLRELEAPGTRGVALARRLLSDGAGPLYNPRGGDLSAELRRVVFMLESKPLGH